MKGSSMHGLQGLPSARGFVGLARFSLTSLGDYILPPFTSRVMKAVLLKASCLQGLSAMYSGRSVGKPVTIRVLKTLKGRPLYKTTAGPSHVFKVRRGDVLVGEVGFYGGPGPPPLDMVSCSGEEVDIGYASFSLETLEAEVNSLESLGEWHDRIVVDIVTPLTITARLLAPPGLRPLLKGKPKAYRLLAAPGYIIGQAVREWAMVASGMDPVRSLRLARRVALYAELLVEEVDFRLRPVTAIYGRSDNGDLLKVRGITGSIVLEPLDEDIGLVAWKALRLASFLGLGKSRSIGFGEIVVSPGRAGASAGSQPLGERSSAHALQEDS
ncbi:MAG: CRISPR system precrRNA processing endoribonuclease RAMP protein Cas6 [Desulfurococcales archaeon]|nr:CRISPR system precrRNA processing endoribonuclease RAMP protein Cas6 [Desulfurococcales archaeon]